ncbi:MAG TPA: tetratricopeptide repeat protein [Burkholderiaceae bacterium]
MSQFRLNTLAMRLAVVGLAASLNVLPAHAQSASAPKGEAVKPVDALSPAVFKALQGLQELIDAKKYAEAYAKVDAAEAVPNRTEYENFIINRNRGAIASLAGDTAVATKAITAVVESKRLPPAEQVRFIQGLAGTYYNAKDYPNAIIWIKRYQAEGGTDPQMGTLLGQAYYLSNDFANANKVLLAELTKLEQAGTTPTELQYQLLMNTYVKTNDRAGFLVVLEKLVTHYPTKDNWNDYLQRQRAKPGYPDTALLDFYRLKTHMELELEGDEIMDFADLSMRAGLPAEAKQALTKGYAAGLLGKGKNAKAEKVMLDRATKGTADDLKTMASGEAVAKANKDGLPLVNLGLAYVTNGQYDKGIPMMEEGVKRGVSKRPTDAKLRLGYAYMLGGKTAEAKTTFESLKGEKDATGDLARYWLMFMNKPPKA